MNKTQTTPPAAIERFREKFTFGGRTGIVALKTDNASELEQFLIQELQASRKEVIEEAIKDMEMLIPKKATKKLADNLEKFKGERMCSICGTQPERQREMILGVLQALGTEDVTHIQIDDVVVRSNFKIDPKHFDQPAEEQEEEV